MTIDRIAPTRRPSGPVRGYQRWRDLGFFHWPVPAGQVAALLPEGLDLDTFEGQAYVGLVPFAMLGVRPRWSPEALAFDFLETNVRTYVHVGGQDPGVYFFSLDAASRLAVWAARTGWGLPYFHARMSLSKRDRTIAYQTRRSGAPGPRLTVTYEIGQGLGASRPDSFEHFLVERYFLHLARRGRLWSGQVHHVPYPVQAARVVDIHDELVPSAGLEVSGPPPIAHFAAGVDVEIFDLAPRRPQGSR
jgi:hypothetical protein